MLGNFMELVHQDVYISEMEIEELHSWHHMCAEFQEMATCGTVMERRRKKYRKTLLEILKSRSMEPISSFIHLIIRHLLCTYYFWAACSIENAVMHKTWSLFLISSKSPEGSGHK